MTFFQDKCLILFEQLLKKSSDLIYANSGLLTIEDSIKTFVDRYSHYDKCQQAKALLDKLLLRTNAVIAEKNEDLRSREAELEANLDGQKICHC